MNDKVRVSGSAVSTALTCGRKALYAFHPAYNLEPNSLGPALTRGNIGHKALEVFYTELQQGVERSVAKKNILTRLALKGMNYAAEGDGFMTKMMGDLTTRLDQYFDFYENELDDFDIIGVETLLEAELDSPVAKFAGRVDLVIKYKRGPRKGEVAPLDHKFVYNFWNDNVFIMNAQMPNYIWGLRKMFPDETITRAVVNQVRHRMDAVEAFSRRNIVPTRLEITELINNHTQAANDWALIQMMPKEEAQRKVTRNPTKFACQYCPFIRLCKAELLGEDTELMIKHEFKPNSYGYSERDDE